ncbi:unnamed protein product [Trichobilharzia regenti]|nr:unnamed protein product [Trichobilharzia regenti]
MTVLSGNTGVGKTTFLCEYSLDLAEQGVPTLWGSFEMPLRKVCKTPYSEPLDPPVPSRIADWARMFSQNIPIYFMNLHGTQNVAEVLKVPNITFAFLCTVRVYIFYYFVCYILCIMDFGFLLYLMM